MISAQTKAKAPNISDFVRGCSQYPKVLRPILHPAHFLEAPVSSIYQEDKTVCLITTQNGLVFRAEKVVVSIPTPLYRTIIFSLPLPESKASLADSTVLGYYAKTILIYDKPW